MIRDFKFAENLLNTKEIQKIPGLLMPITTRLGSGLAVFLVFLGGMGIDVVEKHWTCFAELECKQSAKFVACQTD